MNTCAWHHNITADELNHSGHAAANNGVTLLMHGSAGPGLWSLKVQAAVLVCQGEALAASTTLLALALPLLSWWAGGQREGQRCPKRAPLWRCMKLLLLLLLGLLLLD